MIDHLLGEGRHHDAILASAAILERFPTEVYAMVKQATAYGQLLQAEFLHRYPMPSLIPLPLRPRYLMLVQRNQALFNAAQGLGWEPVD